MSKRGHIDQSWANRQKVIRAAVRLKFSIDADNRLNEIIDEEYKKFYKSVQQGKMLPPFDPEKTLGA
jgi:hypothetical protein